MPKASRRRGGPTEGRPSRGPVVADCARLGTRCQVSRINSFPMSTERFVTIARRETLGAAHLAKTLLEDAEIPCFLANTDQAGLSTMYDSSRRGIEIKVPENRLDEARAVLETLE